MVSTETLSESRDELTVPRIVGCFLMHDGRFPILHRALHKPQGGTWGLPAGRIEAGESDTNAVVREVFEETGYVIEPDEPIHLGTYRFGKTNQYDFVAYQVNAGERRPIRREREAHSAIRWVTPEQCDARDDLIDDFHLLLRHVGFVAL